MDPRYTQVPDRNVITFGADETEAFKRSPFVQGFLAGIKGALVGGAAGGITNALRGKSPMLGALVGGLGTGLLTGAAKASLQELHNLETEAALRYHSQRLRDREPNIFMPRPSVNVGRLFSKSQEMQY